MRGEVSDLPFGDLVLTHYHAVRTLGASAFEARRIVAHAQTAALIEERGMADWASEQGRMPRLFAGAETIPGLTRPTDTFDDAMTLDLGNRDGRAAPPRARPHSGRPRRLAARRGDLLRRRPRRGAGGAVHG